jgi:hypothetical protein
MTNLVSLESLRAQKMEVKLGEAGKKQLDEKLEKIKSEETGNQLLDLTLEL